MKTTDGWRGFLTKVIRPGVREGQILTLAPESRLYLKVWNDAASHDFANAFRGVWYAIPTKIRRATSRFWIEHSCGGRPRIEYSNCWSAGDGVFATTGALRGEMQFVARRVDPMPVDAKKYVIAHELAHMHQKARGDAPELSPGGELIGFRSSDRRVLTEEENELNADAIAASWGFPQDPYWDWHLKVIAHEIMSGEFSGRL